VLFVLNIQEVWNPPGLLPALNVIFLSSISFIISILAARSFLSGRSFAVLLLGCGTLALGLGAALVVLPSIGSTANSLITIYNTSALLAGSCHLLSAIVLLTSGRKRLKTGWPALLSFYLIIIVLVCILLVLVENQLWPEYFIAGSGQTDIGFVILLTTIATFALSSFLLWITRGEDKSGFFFWYSIGLGLIAVGLIGVSLQTNLGDPLNWIGRTSQYAGTVFMLVAVVSSVRHSGTWLLPMERALRESEGRYQSLVTLSPDAILVLVEGKFVFANPAAVRLFGARSLEEMMGKDVLERIHPDYRQEASRRLERMHAGEVLQPWESMFVRMDGSPVDVEVTGSGVEFGTKQALQGIVRDITERKKAEQAIEVERARLQAVFDNIPVAIGFTDEKGGVVIENGLLETIWKGKPGLRGVSDYAQYQAFWPDTGEPVTLEEWPAARALTGEASGATFDILRFNSTRGTIIISAKPILDDGGKITGTVWMVQDITGIKRAQRQAEESEQKFRSVLDSSLDAIYRFNLQTGRYEYVSPAFEPVVGYSVEEMLSMNIEHSMALIHHDDLAGVNEALARLSEEGAVEYDYRLRDKNGEYRWVSNHLSLVEDDSGRPLYRDGVVTNVTKRKKAEDELKRSNIELQQFAYVASHDLQEPLRMVMSYLALLNKKFSDELSPQAKEYMSTVTEGAERMRQLVNDLLQYSRVDTQTKEFSEVDMNSVANEVVQELRLSIDEANAEVVMNEMPTVIGDEAQLKQLLTNLVSNAIKFHNDERSRVVITSEERWNEFVLAVRDNGIGIDPQYQDKLFKMFQRLHTRDEYPGTGIGLAIAKKIVERHGGRIWFESELGKGTTFYFTIPR
jgi:PAS domain S-box-containing protein